MGKIIIQYHPLVENYLIQLIDILFEEGYFGFRESAKEYVDNIYTAIEKELPKQNYKNSPHHLKKYGKYYISYSTTGRTTWYIFFTQKESRFIIRHIMNNHTEESNLLNM